MVQIAWGVLKTIVMGLVAFLTLGLVHLDL